MAANTDSKRYLNRELSWLRFNERVLEEAANPANPLLERLKFLAIFESNLDEFYMVRVSGLIEQYEGRVATLSVDGKSPAEQLELVAASAVPMRDRASAIWQTQLLPELKAEGISIHSYDALDAAHRAVAQQYFEQEVFPLCTPLILHPAPTVPFISSRSLNLAVELVGDDGNDKLARVKVPDVLPRLVPVSKRKAEFVLLEDLIRANLASLFPGIEVRSTSMFRVVRDADIEIRELEAGDLTETIEQTLRMRRFGDPVLLEIEKSAPDSTRDTLMRLLRLEASDVMAVQCPLGLDAMWEIASLDRPRLKYPKFVPRVCDEWSDSGTLFQAISERDVLVHHPYDSFRPVEVFVASATTDRNVIGIKQTLYRVGTESPIVESLLMAAEAGKQVAVSVELKARFDESNNLVWAKALERAGAHVTFGFPDLKTHAKLCVVVRREGKSVRTYCHIGTGNYNPTTARLYTDLGLFTCDPEIAQDILNLFNYLTGFSRQREYGKLLVAPLNMREGVIQRIRREIELKASTGKGRIIFKLNSLVDPEIIDVLYEASAAGVKIDLIVRGICCLRPGVKGLSENIRVTSVVGRYLEHSRILYLGNGESPEAWIGSADMMPRNLDRRVEVMAPIQVPEQVREIRKTILDAYLDDTANAWEMRSDGTYVRRPSPKNKGVAAQQRLMEHAIRG